MVDHEHITGRPDGALAAVYQVENGRIRTVWFFQQRRGHSPFLHQPGIEKR